MKKTRKIKSRLSFLNLVIILSYLTGCMVHQPLKPIVQLHPTQYGSFQSYYGVSIAVISCDHFCSVYSNPNEECIKLKFDPMTAGVCPTRIIIFNESDSTVTIDPTQITCSDSNGTIYKPFDSMTAAKAVIDSESFKTYVKGAVAGAVAGAAIGAGIGAALGAVIGGRNLAGHGAAYGATSGAIHGAAGGAESLRMRMAQEVTYNYTSRELKGIELTPNAKTEGIIFFPAVEIDSVQILISSETVEIPIRSKIAARLDRKEPHDFLRSEGARITQPQPSQPKPEPQPQFQTPPQVTETIQGQVVSASEYRDRGFEYYKNAQYNQAIENFTIALSMENNSSYYINRGSSFYELNQYDKAISDFKQAITLAPDKAKAYGWCGNAYYATKSYREASEYFSKAIALEPNNAVLYLNRGHAYAKIGNKSMAASDFKKACELGDEDGCKQLKVLESTQ